MSNRPHPKHDGNHRTCFESEIQAAIYYPQHSPSQLVPHQQQSPMHLRPYILCLSVLIWALGCSPRTNSDLYSASQGPSAESTRADLTKPGDNTSSTGELSQSTLEPIPYHHLPQSKNTVRMLAWNVESGGNNPDKISTQLAEYRGHEIICLSEVDPVNFDNYTKALVGEYHDVRGNTGNSDRLLILIKRERYEILDTGELSQYREHILNRGNLRSPLYVRIKDKQTGGQMIVMTNHLARGNAHSRQAQAAGLREWARNQDTPIIALGDFNMDYDFRSKKGNQAFEEMLKDNVWGWIAPDTLIDTNWSDRDGDGNDDYPDSMLDLAFASGAAKEWNIQCRVIVRPDDFPDDNATSDHRPIELTYVP